MTLEFEPLIGALPLAFGMSAREAGVILGSPSSRRPSRYGPPGDIVEFGLLNLAFDPEDRLFHIGFDKHFPGNLLFEGMDLLRDPDVLPWLIQLDGEPYVWVGFVMLLNLGVRLGGYHEEADEGRTVSLFQRGRYDDKKPRFQPYVKDGNE